MIIRARLDLDWTDFARIATACLLPGRREAAEERVREAFPDGREAMVCLSVRSGFDLLLEALALPEGSEVLFSAVTVPDMARIVRAHGLVPVPVDVDPATLAPDPAALRTAVSERSRVLVVAHLFGAVVDFTAARAFAREHGLLVVEDCAQSYIPGRFHGSTESDVRMLSFGPIKTSTAMGGGVLFVRNGVLRARMDALHAARPLQSRGNYLRRASKYGALQLMTFPVPFAAFRAACRVRGRDYDEVLRQASKGFPGGDLLAHLRQRPCTPLLVTLAHRLHAPNLRVDARARAGHRLADAVAPLVRRPGTAVAVHTHWAFPVIAEDVPALTARLRDHGFDATQGASSLTSVPVAPERPEVVPVKAQAMVRGILFVPAYPEIPLALLDALGRALREGAAPGGKMTAPAGVPQSGP